MKQKLFISLAIFGLISLTGCSLVPEAADNQDKIANPASEYCEQNGGTLELVPDEGGGSRGKCNFDDGSFCEEWAYKNGKCSPGRGNGNTIDVEDIQNNEEISEDEKKEITELIEKIEEINKEEPSEKEHITCTADVKMCDDGTYVSRGGPDCEFGDCPGAILDEKTVQETLKKYESTGSELAESDIELMNEIINIITD